MFETLARLGSARKALAAAAFGIALAAVAPAPAAAQTVLRSVPIGDLRNIDPIWTTAYITRNHAFLVWDTLFGLDAQGRPQPQMVDKVDVSPDRLTYRFTLREGLVWHDGQPVKAADCVASIRRWGARDVMGRALLRHTAAMEVIDERTFEIKLRNPINFVIEALARVESNVPFMMPERLARTDPNQQVPEVLGSGPFRFRRDLWVPGSRVVYEKFAGYRPRSEPASGTAGGKNVHVDRVEWRYIPDSAVQVAALNAGEVDLVENPQLDLISLLQRNPDVTVELVDPVGSHAFMRLNHTQPPFNNPRIRQAVQHAVNQQAHLRAAYADPRYWQVCQSYFGCGTPLETTAGAEPFPRPDPERARALLREAGYNNERVVILQPTDISHLNTHAQVMHQTLRGIGMNAELLAADWSTVTSRRTSRAPVDQGGWSVMVTAAVVSGLSNPIANAYIATPCEGGLFGWPCDERIEALRNEYATAATQAEQKRIVEALQRRIYEVLPYHILGQYKGIVAYRRTLSGVLQSPARLYWNIQKRQ